MCNRRSLMSCITKSGYILIFTLLLALVVIYSVYDPSASVLFPKCPFLMLTGYPCAGCGSQRAVHALLNLELAEAVRYNFLVVIFIPIILLLCFLSIFRRRFPKLYLITHHKICAYAFLAIILLWWVLRIVFGWYV